MSTLFDTIQIGAISAKNRIAMAPLTRVRALQNIPQPIMVTYYEQRSTAGLIVSEGIAISHQGQGYANVPGLYTDAQVEGWKRITDAVHKAGGKIVAQLWHVGRISHVDLQPGGGAPVAPSAIIAKEHTYLINADGSGNYADTSMPRALEAAELPGIIADHRLAARNAMKAGFDGVEIHASNGYLLDQFFHSSSNHRTDDFGGSIENRARFPLDVVEAVIAEIGSDKTGVRLSPASPVNDVHDPDPQPLFDYVVDALSAYNLAFLHITEGSTGGDRAYYEGPYPFDFKRLKQVYRDGGGKGVWMVNNGYSGEMAQEAVASGYADMVSFGRDFIANPDLPRRIREKAPLNVGDQSTFYGSTSKGYTDYPFLP